MSVIYDALRELDRSNLSSQTTTPASSLLVQHKTPTMHCWIKVLSITLIITLVFVFLWFLWQHKNKAVSLSPAMIDPPSMAVDQLQNTNNHLGSFSAVVNKPTPKHAVFISPKTLILTDKTQPKHTSSHNIETKRSTSPFKASMSPSKAPIFNTRSKKVIASLDKRTDEHAFLRQKQIALLIPQLINAIQQQNIPFVQQQLKKLDRLDDSSHFITMKMHAYWALQQHKFKEAIQLYQTVLLQQPDDFEGNMNLAMAEIQLQYFDKARERLMAMNKHYPDDKRVHAMLLHVKDM